MKYLSGKVGDFTDIQYQRLAEYRHKVFVEHLGWEKLHSKNNREEDQFDGTDTIYVMAEDERCNVIGCCRILPTTRPYLLGDVFPELLDTIRPPCSQQIWELSRFSTLNITNGMENVMRMSSLITNNLIRKSFLIAAENGAERLVTVSPVGVERLFSLQGINFRRGGTPKVVGGQRICAYWIDISRIEDLSCRTY